MVDLADLLAKVEPLDIAAEELLELLVEKASLFRERVQREEGIKELLGDNFIGAESYREIFGMEVG